MKSKFLFLICLIFLFSNISYSKGFDNDLINDDFSLQELDELKFNILNDKSYGGKISNLDFNKAMKVYEIDLDYILKYPTIDFHKLNYLWKIPVKDKGNFFIVELYKDMDRLTYDIYRIDRDFYNFNYLFEDINNIFHKNSLNLDSIKFLHIKDSFFDFIYLTEKDLDYVILFFDENISIGLEREKIYKYEELQASLDKFTRDNQLNSLFPDKVSKLNTGSLIIVLFLIVLIGFAVIYGFLKDNSKS